MSIFKLKFQAHRFVNLIFYFVVFIIGFLVGLGVKKIDFNNLISDFLFIDDVQALSYDISSSSFTKPTSTNFYNEDTIYDLFDEANQITGLNLSFNDYSNIILFSKKEGVWTNSNNYYYAFCDSPITGTLSKPYVSGSCLYIRLDYYYQIFSLGYSSYDNVLIYNNGATSVYASTESSLNPTYILDFSMYPLEFNENLFKDNPDFKEVCVDSNKKFIISSTEYVNGKKIFSDFLWFPYGLYGLYEGSYDSKNKSFTYLDKSSTAYHYYFTNKTVIDESFDSTYGLEYLLYDNSYYSYEDRYLYYGWTARPFDVSYSENLIMLPFFYFENPITYSSIGNNTHGGGGTRLEVDDEIEIFNQYCFYIKNNYVVEYLDVDENGNMFATVVTPDGTLDVGSDEINNKPNGLMSQVNSFISQIKDTLNFIREHIYNFYLSMPLLFRRFLMSVLTVLIIKLIIEMVVR